MRAPFVVLFAGLLVSDDALAGRRGGRKKDRETEWRTEPYLRPLAGVSVFSDGDSTTQAATVGGQAGILYWEKQKKRPHWEGNARAALSYVVSSGDASGYDVRVGNFIGPAWRSFGIQTGPDVFYSRYQFGDAVLDPTTGLGWPALATAHAESLGLYAGVEPSWFLDSDRATVDWGEQDVFGFGDEFAYLAGASFRMSGLSFGVAWSNRITAYGAQQTFGLTLNVAPEI